MRRLLPLLIVFATAWACTQTAPPAGFIEQPQRMEAPSKLPFQRVWVKQHTDWRRFRRLNIAPIDASYMLEHETYLKGDSMQLATRMAAYFEGQLKAAFARKASERFVLDHRRAAGVLVLEFALVELKPLARSGPVLDLQAKVSAAFECRFRDGGSGEVIATIADRRLTVVTFVNRTKVEGYPHLKAIIDEWAEDFGAVAAKAPAASVQDHWPFELKSRPRE